MQENWGEIVKQHRVRYHLTQQQMAQLMRVAQRTISRWERGDDEPSVVQKRRLRDLGWEPSAQLLQNLAASIPYCPAPRALSRLESIRLELVSPPAIAKRPSVVNWIGQDLAPIACGVLQEILDDRPLQRTILAGEVSTLITTTESVLKTPEHESIGRYQTTISYFFHEGVLFQDAVGYPAAVGAECGYHAVPREGMSERGAVVARPQIAPFPTSA